MEALPSVLRLFIPPFLSCVRSGFYGLFQFSSSHFSFLLILRVETKSGLKCVKILRGLEKICLFFFFTRALRLFKQTELLLRFMMTFTVACMGVRFFKSVLGNIYRLHRGLKT